MCLGFSRVSRVFFVFVTNLGATFLWQRFFTVSPDCNLSLYTSKISQSIPRGSAKGARCGVHVNLQTTPSPPHCLRHLLELLLPTLCNPPAHNYPQSVLAECARCFAKSFKFGTIHRHLQVKVPQCKHQKVSVCTFRTFWSGNTAVSKLILGFKNCEPFS